MDFLEETSHIGANSLPSNSTAGFYVLGSSDAPGVDSLRSSAPDDAVDELPVHSPAPAHYAVQFRVVGPDEVKMEDCAHRRIPLRVAFEIDFRANSTSTTVHAAEMARAIIGFS